jgi:hypothetical protein
MRDKIKPNTCIYLLFGLISALLLCAATCENQDYRALEAIDLLAAEGDPPLSRTVIHPYSGRNTVDFALYNRGDDTMRVRLTAATVRPAEEDEADADDMGLAPDIPIFIPPTPGGLDVGGVDMGGGFNVTDYLNALDEDSPNLSRRFISVGPGESRIGRFGEEEGLIGVTLIVLLECLSTQCDGRLEFVVLLGRLECRSTDDCDSSQVCQVTTGRCVADPNADTCATAAPAAPARAPWAALLLLTALLAARRRPARAPAALTLAALTLAALTLAALTLAALTLAATPAWANRTSFEQPTAQLTFSGGLKQWTGALSEDAGSGLSLDITEALHYRYLGFQLSVGTAYYLTQQQAPPLSTGVQTYSLRLGPRLILPFGDFEALLDLEYERLGLISNALIRQTGPGLGFHAFGASASARWVPLPFLVELRAGFTWVPDLDSGQLGLWLSFGRLGRL